MKIRFFVEFNDFHLFFTFLNVFFHIYFIFPGIPDLSLLHGRCNFQEWGQDPSAGQGGSKGWPASWGLRFGASSWTYVQCTLPTENVSASEGIVFKLDSET